jgi:hypothetical protein
MRPPPEDWTDEEKITGKLTKYVPPLVPYIGPRHPYENDWAEKLTTEAKSCFVIIHAEQNCPDDFEYDDAYFGEMLEWRGVRWDKDHHKNDGQMRLHDNQNPTRVIWYDPACLTTVPDNEVLNASIDPLSWLDWYDSIRYSLQNFPSADNNTTPKP